MAQSRRLMIVAPLVVGVLLIAYEVFLEKQGPPLSGTFGIARHSEAVSQRILGRDFHDRLAHAGSAPRSVTCREDLAARPGSTARCDAHFRPNWKSGTASAIRTGSGWLADRVEYAVTAADDRAVEFSITPGLSRHILGDALSQDLITLGYLKCPDEGITGIVGTTVSCEANYGYPDGPCSDPVFDEQGHESPFLRRCTLLIGVQHVNGLSLDVQILQVTPPP